jgi:hypothetical protein
MTENWGFGKKCNQIGVILSKHLLYNLASVCLSWCGLDENCERKNRDTPCQREQAASRRALANALHAFMPLSYYVHHQIE